MGKSETFRLDDDLRAKIAWLGDRQEYRSKSEVIRAAVEMLYDWHQPSARGIVAWQPLILAEDAVCAETGQRIPAGTTAYRQIYDDGTEGTIVCRAMVEDDG